VSAERGGALAGFDVSGLAPAVVASLLVAARWDAQAERQRQDLERALEGLWSTTEPIAPAHWAAVAREVERRSTFLAYLAHCYADAKVHTKARRLQRDELACGRRISLGTARARVAATTNQQETP
jgi:hypothetical protein